MPRVLRRTAAWRRVLLRFVAAWTVAFAGGGPLCAQNPPPHEYQIKAAFLFNFVQFVEWPEDAFESPQAPIRIGVLGANPFQGKLLATVQGESVRGRPLEVKHSARVADLLDSHVLFVSSSERGHLTFILDTLAGRPVLTVGELSDFGRRGGVVNFYLEGQKVRFEINRFAAQRNRLRLASQMLRLARLVGPDPEEER